MSIGAGLLFLGFLMAVVLVFAEPHLYRRFGSVLMRHAYSADRRMGSRTAKSFRNFEIVVRTSIVVPLSIVVVLLVLSIAFNGLNQ